MSTQNKAKKFDPYAIELDEEEREILKSYEDGKLRSVSNLDQEMKLAKEIAANTLRKDARITLRISSTDLSRLKQKAAYEGLPYQTNMRQGILGRERNTNRKLEFRLRKDKMCRHC